jgi:hypothetical protein
MVGTSGRRSLFTRDVWVDHLLDGVSGTVDTLLDFVEFGVRGLTGLNSVFDLLKGDWDVVEVAGDVFELPWSVGRVGRDRPVLRL